ncbi:hypothetical protein [Halalkalicoccus sp. NIPERK01]|uniref:DUF7118 family protein n=1 Tax=Halalkalicoccus sp. NIPERK01 TaxID=3053469 RepID=UPI00256F2E5C|nr:hypothetical protein [Halalkalicoccus sp. NIPERK01]MDL5363017.1 hypothetical protein [Halalkalicoccus sp. NIPERK01]
MSEPDPERRLADAHERYEAACEAVEAVGEGDLRRLERAREDLAELFSRYEGRATGTGDFKGFIEFQSALDDLVSSLPEDLPHREVFEAVEDGFDKRRLNEADFERARELLGPVDDDVERLTERAAAREDLREARRAVESRIAALDEEIAEYDRLLALNEVDLDAPVADLRVPIEGYNEAVEAAFSGYLSRASTREVVAFLDRTEWFPLVETPDLPADLRAYIARADAGTESVPKLLEYADYSRSKLDHYVEDADALKRAVATQRTALERIDATPFRLAWPPRPADELRYQLRELRAVVPRFAPEETVARLREVRTLTRDPDYERLRRAAEARERLGAHERERLESGALAADRKRASERIERLRDALERYASTIAP